MGPMVAPWDDRCKRDVNCARTIQSAADRNRFVFNGGRLDPCLCRDDKSV